MGYFGLWVTVTLTVTKCMQFLASTCNNLKQTLLSHNYLKQHAGVSEINVCPVLSRVRTCCLPISDLTF